MPDPVALKLATYAPGARALVVVAQQLADDRAHPEVEPLHLLYRLFDGAGLARDVVQRLGVDPDDVLVEAELCLRRLPQRTASQAYLSPRMLDLLARAEEEGRRSGRATVDEGHLLLATAQSEGADDVGIVLRSCGVTAAALRGALMESAAGRRAVSVPGAALPQEPADVARLQRFGRDLTWLARQGTLDPVVGRDDLLRRVQQVLVRRGIRSPLLVGEPGVGKHAIVRALASRWVAQDAPELLSRYRILELDVPALWSNGSGDDGLRELLAAVRDAPAPILVYLRDVAALLGDRSRPWAVHLIARALREGALQLLLATDPASYKRYLDGTELGQQCGLITVPANTVDETIAVLRGVVARYERAHGLTITDPALVTAAQLAKRYLPFVELPKAAIDLVDEAAARVLVAVQSVPPELDRLERAQAVVRLQLDALQDDKDPASQQQRTVLQAQEAEVATLLEALRARFEREQLLLRQSAELKREIEAVARNLGLGPSQAAGLEVPPLPELRQRLQVVQDGLSGQEPLVRDGVGPADVAEVVAERTGVPVNRMLEAEADKLLRMEERVSERVIGQAKAVSAVSRAVRRSRVGLRAGRRPIGSFMFLGSSGVGKTELAKALAEFLFDDEAALTRLDMSEFMEKHSVARLLGSPPGYVDSESGGFLTEAVRRRPYSVVLLDEVEKAHPEVFDIMLQVLDDGQLTDARGRPAYFTDTVVIMTSNLGSQHMLDPTVPQAEVLERVRESLHQRFRPEFLNRIDEIVVFEPLDKCSLRRILEIQIGALQGLLSSRQVDLSISADVFSQLVDLGYEPAFGARPLRRVLQRQIQDPLAELLLRHRDEPLTVTVEIEQGVCELRATPSRPAS